MFEIERVNETTGEVKTICLYTVADLSRALDLRIGKKRIGRNGMFKILLHNHLITRDRQPAQSLINMDLAIFHGCIKSCRMIYMVCFTEKGFNYLINGFQSGRFQVYLEPTIRKKKIGVT
jgi:hypothetical protein